MGGIALVLIDPDDQAVLDVDGLALDGFERVVVRTVDYDRLAVEAETLIAEAHSKGVEFVLYSRNDQVFARRSLGRLIRAFRTGYSTLSGIDQEEAHAQARIALADLKRGCGVVPLPQSQHSAITTSGQTSGTFSLIFDTEQIGERALACRASWSCSTSMGCALLSLSLALSTACTRNCCQHLPLEVMKSGCTGCITSGLPVGLWTNSASA